MNDLTAHCSIVGDLEMYSFTSVFNLESRQKMYFILKQVVVGLRYEYIC